MGHERDRDEAMNSDVPSTPSIGHYFADLLVRRGQALDGDIRRLLERLCEAASLQHSCLDLAATPEETLHRLQSLDCVGDGGDRTPLVLRGGRLYLQRYFVWEKQVAALLEARNRPRACARPERLRERIDRLFPPRNDGNGPDRQRVAALQALTRQLLIITGGPGTGKTHTVANIVALLLELSEDEPVIRMAAPTGKAAMRLKESIRAGLPQSHSSRLTDRVTTLHRLLGPRPGGRGWRHDARNPINADVLIVDEASMIDLPMAHRLFSALPPDARLILLGDADQLPSVDVGNVLADLCGGVAGYSREFADAAREFIPGELPVVEGGHKLLDAVCRFERNYRFAPESGLGRLTREIKAGTASFGPDEDGLRFLDLADSRTGDTEERLAGLFADYIRLLSAGGQPDAADLLRALDRTRVLCARRKTAAAVNRALETILEQRGLKPKGQDFYTGKPVMITRNDYELELFNGDTGVCVPGDDGEFLVAFPDVTNARGEMKRELVPRLPHRETCFAMTVHKSQGSEFEHVVLLMDDSSEAFPEQLQTRALLYTAATRARSRLSVYGNAALWRRALENTSARASGLGDFLVSSEE